MEKLKKLLLVSFWYKDHGYWLSDGVDSIIKTCEDYFAKCPPEHYDELLNQIDIIITNFDKRSKMDLSLFAINVYVLTRAGKIPNDQFNGMQYMYEEVH